MNKKRIGWMMGLGFGVCIGIFYLGNVMTVQPEKISGNGNPALIGLFLLFFFILFFMLGWMELMANVRPRLLWYGFVFIPMLLVAGYRYQMNAFDRYRTYVTDIVLNQEGRGGLDYANSITSDVFSIYMNNQLFNVNTFFMYVGLTLWIGIALMLLNTKAKPDR
ncbi:MAG: hypothetical protein LPJ96_07565 [Exiguobacterium sp.]|uniref:hypothetical protein n=1 Tax=Exiguobacterium TaxID=33986 RepID=UPI0004A9B08F|nr:MULTISPECIES: hypothetical protein [Exiguobacterium]MDX5323452.1 hypothetical protein [Exiguobacterium sp.]KDN59059.1 hypothetical protein DI14_06440 [Exiguobacterium sp. AB2]MDX5425245.1 hypothetical protein [Exiguobacterium sp.]MDX6772668.1 hypothetical protein [Exiguobacterium sp.]QUE86476.1 hypothetical protein KB235_00605 [Exiguobacterium alkaliphilum]